jgi:hypothetical protein
LKFEIKNLDDLVGLNKRERKAAEKEQQQIKSSMKRTSAAAKLNTSISNSHQSDSK